MFVLFWSLDQGEGGKLNILWTFGMNITNLSKDMVNHTMNSYLWDPFMASKLLYVEKHKVN